MVGLPGVGKRDKSIYRRGWLTPVSYCHALERAHPTWRGQLPRPGHINVLRLFLSLFFPMNDTDYEQKLEALYKWGAELFKGKETTPEIIEAGRAYYSRGEEEGFSIPELLDYLAVSTPSVLEEAGFSDGRSIEIMDLLGEHLT